MMHIKEHNLSFKSNKTNNLNKVIHPYKLNLR